MATQKKTGPAARKASMRVRAAKAPVARIQYARRVQMLVVAFTFLSLVFALAALWRYG